MSHASVDSIEEFSLQTSNFAAEFSQVGGGFYNFTTKSGTNQFHGTGYEYFDQRRSRRLSPLFHAHGSEHQPAQPQERFRRHHRRSGVDSESL